MQYFKPLTHGRKSTRRNGLKSANFCFWQKKEYLATNTSCIQSDLNTLHIDSGSLMRNSYIQY